MPPRPSHDVNADDAAAAKLSWPAAVSVPLVLLALLAGCGGAGWSLAGGPTQLIFAVWLAPAVSALGAVLAFLGLRRIVSQQGAVVGRPMGLVGLFLGIAATVLLGAAALMSAAMLAGSDRLASEAARLTIAAGEQRFADARGALSVSARNSLTNADLRRFVGELERELGAPVTGAEADLELLQAARDALAATPGARDAEVLTDEMPRPIWITTNNDRALAWGWVDQSALARREVKVKDLVVMVADNRVVVLRANGPAEMLAAKLGWSFDPPPEPAPAEGSAPDADPDAERGPDTQN